MYDPQLSPSCSSSPLLSEPLAPRTTSSPLSIGAEELRRLLAHADIQIDKPQRIPADLLRPFQTRLQELLLLPSQSKKLVRATLWTLHETYLCVNTPQALSLSAYKDHVLLVIFPVLPTQHYVLQTWITGVYLDRLRLRYQDPRYDRRWAFQVATPVLLHTAPADLVSRLERHEVRLERASTDGAEEPGSTGGGAITDRVTPVPAATAGALADEDVPPLTCRLHDISLGGACLTVEGTPPPTVVTQRVVTLRLILPGIAPITDAEHPANPLQLSLLGVVRHVRTVRQTSTLNIRFLQRLPAVLDSLFAALEQRFLSTKRPLA